MRSQGVDSRIKKRGVAFAVALVVLMPLLGTPTAHAQKANVGGGVVVGGVEFTNGTSIPPVNQGCENVMFDLTETRATLVGMNTVFTGYAGVDDVIVDGFGASNTCEDVASGSGEISIWASGTGPTGSRIDCGSEITPMSGEYTRVGGVVTVSVRGDCVINQFGTGTVEFVAVLDFSPANEGGGVTDPVTAGDFAGPFTISPAFS